MPWPRDGLDDDERQALIELLKEASCRCCRARLRR
jgi:hypothetical protein